MFIIQFNVCVCVVPAKDLALGGGLVFCPGVSSSTATFVLGQTVRQEGDRYRSKSRIQRAKCARKEYKELNK